MSQALLPLGSATGAYFNLCNNTNFLQDDPSNSVIGRTLRAFGRFVTTTLALPPIALCGMIYNGVSVIVLFAAGVKGYVNNDSPRAWERMKEAARHLGFFVVDMPGRVASVWLGVAYAVAPTHVIALSQRISSAL